MSSSAGEPLEATYRFKHALVQEASYESLLKLTRQQLHGAIRPALRRDQYQALAVAHEEERCLAGAEPKRHGSP